MRHGHTLLELVIVLTILATVLMAGLPSAARWRDGVVARAARNELAARLSWTRVAAASHGGAALVLHPTTARFHVVLGDGTLIHETDLGARFDVAIESGAGADSLVLRYDAVGVGRMMGGTLRFRRGRAEAGLTVTPFGRFRRW